MSGRTLQRETGKQASLWLGLRALSGWERRRSGAEAAMWLEVHSQDFGLSSGKQEGMQGGGRWSLEEGTLMG